MTPFNIPHVTGNEAGYLAEAISSRKLSGDGGFTKRCQALIETQLGTGRSFLTTSCTDALEAAAILCDIQPGDEVILPSYTFVSTANAFALRGAKLRFADSLQSHPNLDPAHVASLITPRTKAIVPVHYAGVACDMDELRGLASGHRIRIVEDAAQAIASTYKGRPLGTLGDLAAFSFHETKNLNAGEGGSLHVNDPDLVQRAEIIREKGTNRSSFFRGEIDKYGWIDIGSSFLPSELTAAFLYAQLEMVGDIQSKRLALWHAYDARLRALQDSGDIVLPWIPQWASNNAHMYYVVCDSLDTRTRLAAYLRSEGIASAFHYQTLHDSRFFKDEHDGSDLPEAARYSDHLLRLPLFYDLELDEADRIAGAVTSFFRG